MIRKVNIAVLSAVFFSLQLSSVALAKQTDQWGDFKSNWFHPDYGWGNIAYRVHMIEEYYIDKNSGDVDLTHHHAVAIGNTGRHPYPVNLVISNEYRDSYGRFGTVNDLEWKWKDRLRDYISNPGETVYGGGNTKQFSSSTTDKPKAISSPGAVADGVYYGTSNNLTLSIK